MTVARVVRIGGTNRQRGRCLRERYQVAVARPNPRICPFSTWPFPPLRGYRGHRCGSAISSHLHHACRTITGFKKAYWEHACDRLDWNARWRTAIADVHRSFPTIFIPVFVPVRRRVRGHSIRRGVNGTARGQRDRAERSRTSHWQIAAICISRLKRTATGRAMSLRCFVRPPKARPAMRAAISNIWRQSAIRRRICCSARCGCDMMEPAMSHREGSLGAPCGLLRDLQRAWHRS